MYYKVSIICVLALMNVCETYKILLVIPFPFKSHSILGEAFLNILLNAGHEVTYINPIQVTYFHTNLSQVLIKPTIYNGINIKAAGDQRNFKNVFADMFKVAYSAITDPSVQKLMENTQSFDLVIAEWMFNDLYSGFSAVFNSPYIWFFSYQYDQGILKLIHEPPNPSLTANVRTNNVPPLNFLQRIQELLYVMITNTWRYLYSDPLETKVYGEIFGPVMSKRGKTLPSYEEMRYNASLALVNTHLTIRDSTVLPQSYKTIGGFHISGTLEPINQELLSILENSKKGVVLFSLGSFLKAEDMSSSLKSDLIAMFSKLNHTVLWKIDEHILDLPSNVQTYPWIPLQSILAHPKCILFITHGGILSITESVHYGVPMIGVPGFADQIVNVKTAVKRGVARMVSMGPTLVEDLKEAIEIMLNDPRYTENMRTLSSLYHDRPLSPGAELLYWVEHVVATRGAAHLRSPALSVPWYQKYYIDLAAVLVVVLISFIFIVNKLFVCIINKIIIRFSNNYSKVKSKKL